MLQNLHTHTNFCDGIDTPREMVETAIEKGFDSIGFSSHATSESGHVNIDLGDRADAYHKAVTALKDEYRGKIKIFLGTELDRYSEGLAPDFDYDYKIGSVHMAYHNGEKFFFDDSYEDSMYAINEIFGGDSDKYIKSYYETVAEMPYHIDFDFVGHFDLLTKYIEEHPDMLNTDSDFYRKTAFEALHSVREKCEFFEVNTGAIGRGYRKTPYPAPFLLDEMKKLKCKLILTSDCHNRKMLDCAFRETKELLVSHGIKELYYLTESGFVGEKIKI